MNPSRRRRVVRLLAAAAVASCCSLFSLPGPNLPQGAALARSRAPGKKPLRIAYSDWPGWTAFEVAIQKGWFKEEGVDVQFAWFDYLPSLEAFRAGKADAVAVSNGDALVMGAQGAKSKMILINDYSNGNDQIVGAPAIKTFRDLRGKRVGIELTLVDHLLFMKGLEKFGMKATDVQFVNLPTAETSQALAAGDVDAIGAWYPVSGHTLKTVRGATALFTSKDVPGLIYDTLAVSPASLAARKAEWAKVVKVWYRVSDFVRDPKTRPEAVALMAAKVGVIPAEYAAALPGTYFLSLAEAKQRFKKGNGLDSLYGSSKVANDFYLTHDVYKVSQTVDAYIYPDLVLGM